MRTPQPFAQEPVMEFDQMPSPIRETLCGAPFAQRDGFVAVPAGPGLDVEVDEAARDRLCMACISPEDHIYLCIYN
jgi:L-alanine-DL-glutamate epimerase-like enolase superfamily enzyme